MGMGFAPTWLRQVSAPLPPPASQNHFKHCTTAKHSLLSGGNDFCHAENRNEVGSLEWGADSVQGWGFGVGCPPAQPTRGLGERTRFFSNCR